MNWLFCTIIIVLDVSCVWSMRNKHIFDKVKFYAFSHLYRSKTRRLFFTKLQAQITRAASRSMERVLNVPKQILDSSQEMKQMQLNIGLFHINSTSPPSQCLARKKSGFPLESLTEKTFSLKKSRFWCLCGFLQEIFHKKAWKSRAPFYQKSLYIPRLLYWGRHNSHGTSH